MLCEVVRPYSNGEAPPPLMAYWLDYYASAAAPAPTLIFFFFRGTFSRFFFSYFFFPNYEQRAAKWPLMNRRLRPEIETAFLEMAGRRIVHPARTWVSNRVAVAGYLGAGSRLVGLKASALKETVFLSSFSVRKMAYGPDSLGVRKGTGLLGFTGLETRAPDRHADFGGKSANFCEKKKRGK